MKRLLLFLLLLPLVGLGQSNNLILNGDFSELRSPEQPYPCPNNIGQIWKAKYWSNADGSIDYFHECSNDSFSDYGVPNNLFGHQIPKSGIAYALLYTYAEPWDDVREYLWTELSDSLQQGKIYSFEYSVSLADSMNFAVSHLGALFTQDDTRFWADNAFLVANAQVENTDSVMVNKIGWSTVRDTFVAQGGEKFLSIGVFRKDEDIQVERVSNHPYIVANWEASAYYIDDVQLYEIGTVGFNEVESEKGLLLYPNPTTYSIRIQLPENNLNATGSRIYDMTGRLVHQQRFNPNMDVDFLDTGTYIIVVATEEGNFRGTVQKE